MEFNTTNIHPNTASFDTISLDHEPTSPISSIPNLLNTPNISTAINPNSGDALLATQSPTSPQCTNVTINTANISPTSSTNMAKNTANAPDKIKYSSPASNNNRYTNLSHNHTPPTTPNHRANYHQPPTDTHMHADIRFTITTANHPQHKQQLPVLTMTQHQGYMLQQQQNATNDILIQPAQLIYPTPQYYNTPIDARNSQDMSHLHPLFQNAHPIKIQTYSTPTGPKPVQTTEAGPQADGFHYYYIMPVDAILDTTTIIPTSMPYLSRPHGMNTTIPPHFHINHK